MRMNEALKIENIKEYFAAIDRTVTTNFTYGYREPRKRWFLLWGAYTAFKYKYYIIAFYPDEIVLAPLSAMGKFKEDYQVIPKEAIQAIEVKKGLMQYKVTIQTNEEKIKLKCNKFILNTPWQKENTIYLENNGWHAERLGR